MKKLMILGAGIYQVPLIKKAKEMGLHVIVASYPGNYPGFALADEIVYADTRDKDKILEAAKAAGIDGIVTTGTDVAVISLGYVCEKLGLAGIPLRAAEILTDKAAMKEAFRGSVSTAAFEKCRTKEEAEQAAARLGYPVMVKACDSSGSRGINKVSEQSGLEDACREALSVTKKPYFLVEKYVQGREIGLDAFVAGGKIQLFLPHKKYVYRAGTATSPGGHAFPCDLDEDLRGKLHRELEQIIAVTGMDNCAVNSDVILTDSGEVSILEAGGRAGATCIPELISVYTGIDYYELMIRCALGEEISLTQTAGIPCQARLIVSSREGILRSVDEETLASLRSGNVQIDLDVKAGDPIPKLHNGTDRIGQVIAAGLTEEEMDQMMDRITACLEIIPKEEAI